MTAICPFVAFGCKFTSVLLHNNLSDHIKRAHAYDIYWYECTTCGCKFRPQLDAADKAQTDWNLQQLEEYEVKRKELEKKKSRLTSSSSSSSKHQVEPGKYIYKYIIVPF
jgi:hypothetical protein